MLYKDCYKERNDILRDERVYLKVYYSPLKNVLIFWCSFTICGYPYFCMAIPVRSYVCLFVSKLTNVVLNMLAIQKQKG